MAAPGFRKEMFADLKAALPAQLPAYLKKQRWFGAKARELRSTEVLDFVPLQHDGFEAFVLFVNVEYQVGGADLYSIPLVGAGHAAMIGEEASPVMSISGRDGDEHLAFADALTNEAFLSLMLDAIERDSIFRGEAGELRTSHTPTFSLQETGAAASLRPRAIKAEQSNSSIAYGNRLMLKFFRRLEEGVSPDLEMSSFLTGKAHYRHTPQLLGSLEYCSATGQRMTQGILQAFVPNQGDAWQYTMRSISSFYGDVAKIQVERSLTTTHNDSARASIAPFLESVGLLAKRTAELHLALVSDSSDPDFTPELFDANFQRSFENSLLELTERIFAQLRQTKNRLPEATSLKAQEILSSEQHITRRFRSALGNPIHALRTRIHGDYHLGQVLYTGSDFVIIDFEGEPARPLSERRLKRSPLQDVAGMLRSFHYAAYAPLLASTGTVKIDESNKQNLDCWAEAWAKWVGDRFLTDYLKAAGGAAFLPPTRAGIMALLQLHVLEKAVYELGYELNNRPEWIAIPLHGISKVLETSSS